MKKKEKTMSEVTKDYESFNIRLFGVHLCSDYIITLIYYYSYRFLTQIFLKLIGLLLSPCACSFIANGPCTAFA